MATASTNLSLIKPEVTDTTVVRTIYNTNLDTIDGRFSATYLAVQAKASVSITGGSITGITDLAVADGGTGSSTAANARTALGLAIGTNVQAYDATLLSIALLGTAADKIAYTTDVDTWAETALTAFGRSILDDANEATFKATVNLEIGTDVQAYDASLSSIAALTYAEGSFIALTAEDTYTVRTYAQTLTDIGGAASGANTDITSLGGITGAIATPTNISMTGELDITGALGCIDLNPAFQTTKNIIDITPTATLNATQIWKGVFIDGSALDPNGVDVEICGYKVDFSGVSETNFPSIHGFIANVPFGQDAFHIMGGQLHIDTVLPATAASEFTTLDIVIDSSALVSTSEYHAIDVATTGTPAGDVVALGTHFGVDVIHQHISTFATPSQTEFAGVKHTGGNTWVDGIDAYGVIFAAVSDAIYVGSAAKFDEIEVIMTTGGTKSVAPTFWYNTAADTWTQFYPADDTDGFQQSGEIRWNVAGITATWTGDGDPGGAETTAGYWIKIVRTRVGTVGSPDPATVKIGLATEYSWDKDGDITTKSLVLTTPLGAAYGGTGVANNAASTLTISGNFATTLTVTEATGVTLPASGTLLSAKSGLVGVNVAAIVPMHVIVTGEGLSVEAADLSNTHYVFLGESEDAVLALASAQEGGHGSAIDLLEMHPAGTLVDKWTICRESSTSGSSLEFIYGTDPSYAETNPVLASLDTSGNFDIKSGAVYKINGSQIKLNDCAATASYDFRSVITDPNGTGAVTFTQASMFIVPDIGVATASELIVIPSQYPVAQSGTYVKATSTRAAYSPDDATDPLNNLTGGAEGHSWMTPSGTVASQRFHIDLGGIKAVKKIYYENFHNNGGTTTRGVQNFTFWGSNTASSFAELTYATDTGWTEITLSQNTFDQHAAANAADPKYITVSASGNYRYYAFKFADNYGDASYIGVRRIELQTDGDVKTGKVTLISQELETAAAGNIEFLTDKFYGTITTGAARKTFAFLESPTFTGSISIPEKTPVNAVASQGTITMAGIATADETFVIDSQTFTWKASRSVAGEVTIGADAPAAVTNIVDAVTADLATVTAVDGAGDTVTITAVTKGVSGDSIVFTEASTNMTVDGAGTLGTTTAGVDGTVGVANEIAQDATYFYVCIDTNTVADTNWRRIALGSAY